MAPILYLRDRKKIKTKLEIRAYEEALARAEKTYSEMEKFNMYLENIAT